MPNYNERGYTGLQQFMGFVETAYHRDLRWPGVQPLYSRMRRSDPEVSIVRVIFSALARGINLQVELPDKATDKDKRAGEFIEQTMEDMDGGQSTFIDTLIGNVPFFGWGWWEIVPGMRSETWTPPGEDDWRSQYKDNLIGIRRLGWRDSSSFFKWDFSDNGKVRGMTQYIYPEPEVTLPLDDSLHLTFGDAHNPEGLTPLEAVWRLERIKYGLEIVQGMGFEHSAGYLSVKTEKKLDDTDKVAIREAARAIMTAQEGNYATWPAGFVGELMDVNFAAAASILEAIKYYGVLKLQLFNMQWVALSATTGTGSLAAMSDSSSMFMVTFNAMMDGFASQIDKKLVSKLAQWNPSIFTGLTARPRITVTPLGKKVSLSELAQLLAPIRDTMPMGDEDFAAIRKLTGFLPEALPDTARVPSGNAEAPANDTPQAQASLQARWARYMLQHPDMVKEVARDV